MTKSYQIISLFQNGTIIANYLTMMPKYRVPIKLLGYKLHHNDTIWPFLPSVFFFNWYLDFSFLFFPFSFLDFSRIWIISAKNIKSGQINKINYYAKGRFFSENSMGLKKICQITILNLNFWNYILFYVAKKHANIQTMSLR